MTKEVSRETRVPEPYIAKIFQKLARMRLLRSRRGPAGGFALMRNPAEISLYEVVQAVDDTTFLGNCVMGLDECLAERACPLHDAWVGMKSRMLGKLKVTTVLQLARQISRRQYLKLQRAKLSGAFRKKTTRTQPRRGK